jgi:glycerate dehydrogenase
MKIVFLDSDTLPYPIEQPSWVTEWVQRPATEQSTEAVVQALQDTEICITNKIKITPAILAQCPKLKFICVAATGYDCIDLRAAREHGVTVSNIPGYSAQSVAEHVIACLFALIRSLPLYTKLGRTAWPESKHFCVHSQSILNVAGATLGIFGNGAIGQAVAMRANALGMQVLFAEHRNRPTVREGYTRFETVIAQSDVITLHCPLNETTRHMISQAEVANMKPGSFIINSARGPLINETALLDGLQTGHLGGAALDVLTEEPPVADNPLLTLDHPNLLITPHIAWAAQAGQANLARGVHINLEAFYQGQPVHVVS